MKYIFNTGNFEIFTNFSILKEMVFDRDIIWLWYF